MLEKGVKKVYAGARNVSTLSELQATYGDRLVPIALDVTDEASTKAAAAKVSELDILVNNAGVFSLGKIFSDLANSSLKQNLDVNVWGLINVSNSLVNQLKKDSETAIVNIASVAGLANMPMAGTYSVSKAAVHSITQGMRGELANTNTLVVGVYPGPIDTDMAAGLDMPKDTVENVARNVVQGLMNGAEDIYPDAMSEQVGAAYATTPKGVEKQFSTFL
ncbi:MAG: NADP-dependent 3-hydroxy acid dehydrogenase YdfG [Saprospiraceae bacterium]